MAGFFKQFGKKVKYYRKLKNFSQEQLAEKLEIAPTTMSNIETGKGFVSGDTLQKLISILDIKLYDLFIFGDIESSDIIYKKILNNLKSDKIKSNPRLLMLLYELTEEFLNTK